MSLNDKIKYSLDLLREGEKLALSLNPEFGYYLAFSGGDMVDVGNVNKKVFER